MKIIFFSSHTATWYFALAEATIASALQEEGHNILFITPGNKFPKISNLKQEKILRKEFGLKGYEIGAELTENDLKEISAIIKKLNIKNFEKLVIDDIQIGKMAMYELLLNHKKMDSRFTQKEWKECVIYLKQTLISFFACRAIIRKEKPDRILVYGELYSVNRVWERYSVSKNIPVYFLHHGLNFSDIDNTLIVAKTTSIDYFHRLTNIWAKLKNIPVSKMMLSYVTENFFELLNAKSYLVYSSPKAHNSVEIRKFFKIDKNQKILTATMSSYDELFAAQYVGAWNLPKHLIFKSQAEWVGALTDYVKNKKNLFLIIRIHPREFPNKRDSVKSEHARILEKIFMNLPDNVKINWSIDNLSIYDLAQETDVFLNAWSSVGVEMSLLGIPVVVYSKDLILYPSDLNYVAKNKKDYFTKIELALKKGWSYERIRKTYRWLALYYYHTIVRLRNKGVNKEQSMSTKLISILMNIFYKFFSPKLRALFVRIYYSIPGLGVGKRQIDDCRRQLAEHVNISIVEKMLEKSEDTLVDVVEILASKVTEKEEDYFIRMEVKRMYKALYGNLPKGTEIKKDDLQYNLKEVFIKHD